MDGKEEGRTYQLTAQGPAFQEAVEGRPRVGPTDHAPTFGVNPLRIVVPTGVVLQLEHPSTDEGDAKTVLRRWVGEWVVG